MIWSSFNSILSWILMAIGTWKILTKCGQKGWYGLIPGLRYYKLGVCGGRERDGIICMILDLLTRVLNVVNTGMPDDTRGAVILEVFFLVLVILFMVYEIRVTLGLLNVFAMKKRWIILWIVVPWIPAMIMGFGKKFQPVRLNQTEGEELAGTAPSNLDAAVDNYESDSGLVVHVRARTVRQLSKVRYLLKDINLTIPPGSLVLLLGGSGSGKTTLVNAINGYEKADADVRLNGVDIYKNYEQMKYKIGFVPQQELLRMNDTVVRTMGDAALLRLPVQIGGEERQKIIDNVMDTLGLSDSSEGLVGKKSGGMKKRISIGTELISDPELFILDEPDSGLDGVIARELFEKLRSIADEGKIVLAITHTPDRVVDLFDKVIVLARDSGKVGRLAFYGTPDEARAFFGKTTMEQVVMAINRKEAGGEGRADEFIEKFAQLTVAERDAADGKVVADHER